jgi:hypothetical protein
MCEPSARLGSGPPLGTASCHLTNCSGQDPGAALPHCCNTAPSLSPPQPAFAALCYLNYSWTAPVYFSSSFQFHLSMSGLSWLFLPAPCRLPCHERAAAEVPGSAPGPMLWIWPVTEFKSLISWVLVMLEEYFPDHHPHSFLLPVWSSGPGS